MSLHLNDFAGQPILTYVYAPSPGYLRKAIDLKQPAVSVRPTPYKVRPGQTGVRLTGGL